MTFVSVCIVIKTGLKSGHHDTGKDIQEDIDTNHIKDNIIEACELVVDTRHSAFDKNGPIIANGDGEEGENSTGDCLKVQRIIILFARGVRREELIIPIGGLRDGFGGCQLEES